MTVDRDGGSLTEVIPVVYITSKPGRPWTVARIFNAGACSETDPKKWS